MLSTVASVLMSTYAAPPVTFVRGRGTELWDDEGRRYLDFLCGLAVTSLGHSHPAVAAALAEQADTLLHVSNLFANEIGPEVAATLDRLLGGGGQVFFCNSGAEANECAIKLARRWAGRGRHGVVSAYGSFHGRTMAALTATGQPSKHEAFQPLPEGFRYAAWDDSADLDRQLDPTIVVPSSWSPSKARAACRSRRPATSPMPAACATSAAPFSCSTRCRPASAAPASGGASSTMPVCGPMSSPSPRPSATASRSARVGPDPKWPPPSSLVITGARSGVSRWPPRPRRRPCAPWRPRTCRAGRPGPAPF